MVSTLGELVELRAVDVPDNVFLTVGGSSLTFAAANREANRLARGLANIGVTHGEPVALLMANCAEYVLTWLALSKLGAPLAGINTEARGQRLADTLSLIGSRVVIVDAAYLPHIHTIAESLPATTKLVVRTGRAGEPTTVTGPTSVPFEDLRSPVVANPALRVRGPDLALLMSTSGTTGTPKACMISHQAAIRVAQTHITNLGFQPADVLYSPFPLFHIDSLWLTVIPALLLGSTAAIGSGFDPETYWDEIQAVGATVTDFLPDTMTLLSKRPARADDARNPLRLVWGTHVADLTAGIEFERRFAVKLAGQYGLTDAGIVAYSPLDAPRRLGTIGEPPPAAAGKPVHPFDVRVFGDADSDLSPNHVGEIVIRPLEPWAMTSGYYGMPAETLTVNRNLWFHTGDAGYFDDEGFLYVLGRKSDLLCRKGRPVVSIAVEAVADSHPAVLESAMIVTADDEAKLCVVVRAGRSVRAEDLWAHCEARMAPDAVPRYIESLPSLPKTLTRKVEKRVLALDWANERTLDRATRIPTDDAGRD